VAGGRSVPSLLLFLLIGKNLLYLSKICILLLVFNVIFGVQEALLVFDIKILSQVFVHRRCVVGILKTNSEFFFDLRFHFGGHRFPNFDETDETDRALSHYRRIRLLV